MNDDRMPKGFWKLETVYTNGYQIVVFGQPPQDLPEDGPLYHNCDEMGCGFDHAIAIVPVMRPTPELRWADPDYKEVVPAAWEMLSRTWIERRCNDAKWTY
jgi:hypothetical protein